MEHFHPVPKPAEKKKRKKTNGYKHKKERICFYCGTWGAERHEVYGGPNRQQSIDHGFQIDLCPNCHRGWHAQEDPLWIQRKAHWQRKYQEDYEKKLRGAGVSAEQARGLWMILIGRNYTEEVL